MIRHPQIEQSESHRFFGHTDIKLSSQGMKQTNDLISRLANEKVEQIYSSDLSRTQYPAQIYANKHDIEHIITGNLREIYFGEWEGKSFQEIETLYPHLCQVWMKHPFTFQFPDGESIEEFTKRVRQEYQSLITKYLHEQNKSNNLAIITHGGVIRILLCEILGLDIANMWKIQIDYGSFTTVVYPTESTSFNYLPKFQDLHPTLLTMNDIGYLEFPEQSLTVTAH